MQTFAAFLPDLASDGFRVFPQCALGQRGAYPVAVVVPQPYVLQLIFSVSIPDFSNLKRQMKEVRNTRRVLRDKNRLIVNVKMSRKEADPRGICLGVLDDTVTILERNGIAPITACPYCGREGCDVLVYDGGAYRLAHNGCVEGAISTVHADAAHNAVHGNIALGIIGAVLGMIVGSIPSLLVIYFFDRIYAILFALIPLAIYYGYKRLGGKMNRSVLPITIVLSIVAIFFMQIVLLHVYVSEEFSIGFGMASELVWWYLSDSEAWVDLIRSSVSWYIFTALGIFIAWSQISRTSADDVAAAESLRDTVAPYRQG